MRFLIAFLLLVSVAVNVMFAALYTMTVMDLSNRIVFDIDKVRRDHAESMRYMYMSACMQGVAYPEEWRKDEQSGWSQHSSTNYCARARENYEDQFLLNLKTFGRIKQ
jgi:hypothetical protein